MKSLQDFRIWAVSRIAHIGNPSGNSYPGECVSLIQQYLFQVFGIPYAPRGHAKDFVPPTFKSIPVNSKLQPGDIVRYSASASNYWYGHIELIDDDGKALGQNRKVDKRVTRGGVLKGYTAVFRPTKKFTVKNVVKPKRIAKKGTATVTAKYGLNVRESYNTKSKAVAGYSKGQKFGYDSYIDANGYRWLSYIGYSGKRRYVAQRTLNNKVKYVKGGV